MVLGRRNTAGKSTAAPIEARLREKRKDNKKKNTARNEDNSELSEPKLCPNDIRQKADELRKKLHDEIYAGYVKKEWDRIQGEKLLNAGMADGASGILFLIWNIIQEEVQLEDLQNRQRSTELLRYYLKEMIIQRNSIVQQIKQKYQEVGQLAPEKIPPILEKPDSRQSSLEMANFYLNDINAILDEMRIIQIQTGGENFTKRAAFYERLWSGLQLYLKEAERLLELEDEKLIKQTTSWCKKVRMLLECLGVRILFHNEASEEELKKYFRKTDKGCMPAMFSTELDYIYTMGSF